MQSIPIAYIRLYCTLFFFSILCIIIVYTGLIGWLLFVVSLIYIVGFNSGIFVEIYNVATNIIKL